ncbi:MAG: hypothetical protein E7485_08475 [Ruminococcaceae bacterium]|nr:hypothetical protein [Oscillospiraceae bacterium]
MVYSPKKYRETEGIKVRRYGFALDEATLKQVAYEKGITQSIETMTQAQKAQLRYVAILEQAGNIGVLGDMSRTIDTSANQLRILEARLQQFARAVGNMVMPVLSQFLPYMTAFIQLLTEGAQAIAEFLGFELPKIDLNTASVTNGYDDIADATNAATEATEKFKGSLAGVDQLNIIGSKNESGAGDGAGLNYDLNIDLPSYDFLNGVESKTKEIFEGMKKTLSELIPLFELLGAAIAGAGIIVLADKISASGAAFARLSRIFGGLGTGAEKFAVGLAGGLGSFVLWKNALKSVTKGTSDWSSALATTLPLTVGIGAALSKAMGPVGWLITGVGSLAGALWGVTEAQNELDRQLADSIMYSDRGGIAINTLADGFSGYFDTITKGYDDIIANTNAFKDNQQKIEDAADEIYNITGKYQALGDEMTAEDASTISENIKMIADSITTNLGTATQSIIEGLQTKFNTLAESLGKDVDDMVGKFYLLEAMGGSAVTELRRQADTIIADILGGNNSKEKLQELNDVVKKMSGSASTKTTETVGFEMALQNFDYAGIDFGDEDAVKQAFDSINAQAEAAKSSINDAWAGQVLELDSLKTFYEGLGIDAEFDAKLGAGAFDELFADTRKTLDMGYQSELDKIDLGTVAFASMVQNELDRRVSEAQEAINPLWYEDLAIQSFGTFEIEGHSIVKNPKDERVKEQFSGIQEMIDNILGDFDVSGASEASAWLVSGLKDGLFENASEFYTALDDISEQGWSEFKRVNGIASPSKVYAEFGGYIAEGLANGISGNTVIVIAAIDELYRQMIAEVAVHQALIAQKLASGFSADSKFDYRVSDNQTDVKGGVFEGLSSIFEAFGGTSNEDDEIPISITLHSTVEIDGDAVGEAAARYDSRQARVTNGK